MSKEHVTCVECNLLKPVAEFHRCETRVRKSRISRRCFDCRVAINQARKDAKAAGLRRCTVCRKTKHESEFCKKPSGYFSSWCNPCSANEQYRRHKNERKRTPRRKHEIGTEETGFFCRTCGIQKPITEFRKQRSTGRWDYRCKECQIKRTSFSLLNARAHFMYARRVGKRRGHAWDLTQEQFLELHAKPCHYCGFPLRNSGTGLDRKDSLLGYIVGNVVPCCRECNIAKSNFFTFEEMELLGKTISQIKASRAVIS